MNKRVLLVSAQQSFMVNAMVKNLSDESFEVVQVTPDVRDASRHRTWDIPSIVLIYLDRDAGDITEFLVFVKDRLIEDRDGVRLFLVGNEEELEAAQRILPSRLTAGVFSRPLNVKDLVERLNELVENVGESDRRKRILVVDDDATMLRVLKLWLSDHYQVYMANSGMNALSLLARKEVDLILLDYEMPVASGPEVLQMLRSEPTTSHLPVMFLTAKNDKESVMKVMELKPERYLLKTMPPDVLLQNIDEFFAMQKL
ncbi:MAG: response regulator [Lachnospiraceae bacterium]|nr:response regulator [Lachnospiraceae bacterium]